jgi:hypothetical protein
MAKEGVEAYRAKRAKEKEGLAGSATIPIILGAIFALLLATHIGINLRAYYTGRGGPEVFYYVHCNGCGRKLRYRDRQIDHLGRCPLCQKPIRFPKPPSAARTNRWAKIAHIVWG